MRFTSCVYMNRKYLNGLASAAILIYTMVQVFSCNIEDDEVKIDSNGIVVKQPHLWKTSISNDGNLAQVVIATPIMYDGGHLLVGGNKNETRNIISLSSTDGSIDWQWNDLLSLQSDPNYPDPITIYAESYYKIDNKLFFTYTGSSYFLDLMKGTTIWKYKHFRHRFDRNSGIENTYFTTGSNYDPIDEEKIYYGDISSAEEELLLVPDYTKVLSPPVNAQGYVTSLRPFNKDGNRYIAFGVSNPAMDFTIEGLGLDELNLYDLTNNKYVYKKTVVNPARETFGISQMIYATSNLYFQSLNFVHCRDALTGEELWRTPVGDPPLLSTMILINEKLYFAGEDRFLYCIDAITGHLLWKEENTGTCSEMSHLNGVLYYLGGGDGLLHAVDAQTGKHLWKLKSPDLSINTGAWFYGSCTAVPAMNGEKGVVVATTGLHAYGYEAIK